MQQINPCMLVKDLGSKVQSLNCTTKSRQTRKFQCDNAIKRTGFKIVVAHTELESLPLQA